MPAKKNNSNAKEYSAILKEGIVSPMPVAIEPMLSTLVSEPPLEEAWLYEMKCDGFRAVAYLNNGTVDIRSRNNKSFNEKYYPLYAALQNWTINAVVDGELLVLNEQGLPDFSALQLWRSEADGELIYYLFDILWLEGLSLMHLPLEQRRRVLSHIIPKDHPYIRISESLQDSGMEAFRQAKGLHLEGVMAKRSGSPYTIGKRTKDWLKIKTEKTQELIIGGYTVNEGTNKLFSSSLGLRSVFLPFLEGAINTFSFINLCSFISGVLAAISQTISAGFLSSRSPRKEGCLMALFGVSSR